MTPPVASMKWPAVDVYMVWIEVWNICPFTNKACGSRCGASALLLCKILRIHSLPSPHSPMLVSSPLRLARSRRMCCPS